MNREQKLMEMNEVADHIVSAIKAGVPVPMSYVRRYNQILHEVFGDEDPEIQEAEKNIVCEQCGRRELAEKFFDKHWFGADDCPMKCKLKDAKNGEMQEVRSRDQVDQDEG